VPEGGDNMVDLVRRDPFRSLFAWPRWLDEFEETFPTTASRRGLRIHETDKDIILEAVVAGVPSEEVDIEIDDGVVRIKAEKKEEEKKKDQVRKASYQYYYTCALSGGQWDKAKAEVEDGILTLTIPKTKAARPRKISVKAKSKAR
jgi:HSP20 family protein